MKFKLFLVIISLLTGIFILIGCGDDRPSPIQAPFIPVPQPDITGVSAPSVVILSDSTGIEISWSNYTDEKDVANGYTSTPFFAGKYIGIYSVVRGDNKEIAKLSDPLFSDASWPTTIKVIDKDMKRGYFYYQIIGIDTSNRQFMLSDLSRTIYFPKDL